MKLLCATHNPHKLQELRPLIQIDRGVELLSLSDLDDACEIPENGLTLQENALIKAQTGYARHGLPCFADDTGLEVTALGGAPGVYSARYASNERSDILNRQKLLRELQGVEDRSARFRTVIAFVNEQEVQFFEGIVKGHISLCEQGTEGFGYDSLFIPEGYQHTFATLGPATKNSISHRARAVQAFALYLRGVVSSFDTSLTQP